MKDVLKFLCNKAINHALQYRISLCLCMIHQCFVWCGFLNITIYIWDHVIYYTLEMSGLLFCLVSIRCILVTAIEMTWGSVTVFSVQFQCQVWAGLARSSNVTYLATFDDAVADVGTVLKIYRSCSSMVTLCWPVLVWEDGMISGENYDIHVHVHVRTWGSYLLTST